LQLDSFDLFQGRNQSASQFAEWLRRKNGLWDEKFHRAGHTHSASHIFGAGPSFILMAAAEDNGVRKERLANVESAGAFWPMNFVSANGNQVGIELTDALERKL